jgi:hypothetical protein
MNRRLLATLRNTLLRSLLSMSLAAFLLVCPAMVRPAAARLVPAADEKAPALLRSLESLRDLDHRSWQLVAFREGPPGSPLRLRIVGYPGRVRLDHPTPLLVWAGRRHWLLEDVTLSSDKLAGDGRAAAAEFDLAPLLADLTRNHPLRLELAGVFTELPVPPYVVKEWRSLTGVKAGHSSNAGPA